MVFGLHIVSANPFLYGAEPLDGDVGAIRAIDQEPDGGVSFKGYTSGRRCHTEHFPSRMRWEGPAGSLIGDFNRQYFINVSGQAKALIEQFEPGVHQFVPVDFVNRQNGLLEHRYWLVICNRLDSVDRDRTTFVLDNGKAWVPADDLVRWGEVDKIPPHIDPTIPSTIYFNRMQIRTAHLWRDKHIDMGGPFVSDELNKALKTSHLTGLKFSDTPMEAV